MPGACRRRATFCKLFGLAWVGAEPGHPVLASLDPNYYGHWQYGGHGCPHDINSLPANPDFFQIINYALTLGNGGVSPAPSTVFTVGASLIDQYDGDDLNDPDPNYPGNAANGNTITIIDYGGASYAYGIEAMSYDDPNLNLARPPFAPNPLSLGVPLNYVLLNRRFENVGEFGYAYNPASTLTSKTLDFASATSKDRAILDFFTYNQASPDAGIVNLNTRNIPVLASIIKGALLNDPGLQNTPTALLSQTSDALNAAQAIVQETTNTGVGHGPALTRGRCHPPGRCGGGAVAYGSRSQRRNKADDRARLGGFRSSAKLEPDDRRNRANRAIQTERARSHS